MEAVHRALSFPTRMATFTARLSAGEWTVSERCGRLTGKGPAPGGKADIKVVESRFPSACRHGAEVRLTSANIWNREELDHEIFALEAGQNSIKR